MTQTLQKVTIPHAPLMISSEMLTYAHVATIPLIFMFFAFYDIAYTPMLVAYTLEILPFNIRAKGFAVMVCPVELIDVHSGDNFPVLQNITVCLTLAFNQFVNPWALDALGWKYVSDVNLWLTDHLLTRLYCSVFGVLRMVSI